MSLLWVSIFLLGTHTLAMHLQVLWLISSSDCLPSGELLFPLLPNPWKTRLTLLYPSVTKSLLKLNDAELHGRHRSTLDGGYHPRISGTAWSSDIFPNKNLPMNTTPNVYNAAFEYVHACVVMCMCVCAWLTGKHILNKPFIGTCRVARTLL